MLVILDDATSDGSNGGASRAPRVSASSAKTRAGFGGVSYWLAATLESMSDRLEDATLESAGSSSRELHA